MIEVLKSSDPEVFELCRAEERRQADKIRLIPSENYVSKAVLEASSSVFTNKYSEGYPGKRYYEGQDFVDPLEQLTIDRAKALFGAAHANVQPYSGSPANLAVYLAFLKPGDKVMGLALPMGGHLTHGWNVSITGALLHVGAVRRPQGHRPHRLRRGPRPGEEGTPRAAVGGRHRLLAPVGLRDDGVDRARGRRALLRGHRPHRRADRRAARTRRRCPTPTSSRRRRTRRCAARAAA